MGGATLLDTFCTFHFEIFPILWPTIFLGILIDFFKEFFFAGHFGCVVHVDGSRDHNGSFATCSPSFSFPDSTSCVYVSCHCLYFGWS